MTPSFAYFAKFLQPRLLATLALAAACARRPEIDAPFANACLSRALGWANNLAREAQ